MDNIIKGYKGIMDLDISSIPEIHKKNIIEQHYKDIEDYKKYQKSLPPKNTYENTIVEIQKKNKISEEIIKKRLKKKQMIFTNNIYILVN